MTGTLIAVGAVVLVIATWLVVRRQDTVDMQRIDEAESQAARDALKKQAQVLKEIDDDMARHDLPSYLRSRTGGDPDDTNDGAV